VAAPGTAAASAACARIAADQQAIIAAARQVVTSQTVLDAAWHRLNTDAAGGQVSIEYARQNVVAARNTLEVTVADRPFAIRQQAALVANAAAALRQAQRDLEDTVLRAPCTGTISVINGTVGEFLGPGSPTTPLAPGSTAPIPSLAGNVIETGSLAGVLSVSRPFVVLDSPTTFQVVLPFQEADATKIASRKTVNVTFDAIPDLTLTGTVLSVAPASTAISSVVNYFVTVVFTQTDPRLRNGLTAHAAVEAHRIDDALSVPNAAVQKRGDQSYVTVVGADGKPRSAAVKVGLVGDERTQILSGLSQGQQVLLPLGK